MMEELVTHGPVSKVRVRVRVRVRVGYSLG